MSNENTPPQETKGKNLYDYQKEALFKIFKCFENAPENFHLLYQLPTGG
ncbi:hypothetical protein G1K96_10900, partial [Tenacibaculum finnmarkense]|nr:hypothetical protein [Tenacibaculum finnmarkense]